MDTKTKIIAFIVCCTVCFASGRYLKPDKVVVRTEIQTVTVERQVENKIRSKDVVFLETTNLDGSKVRTITDKSVIDSKIETGKVESQDSGSEKISESIRTAWLIQGAAYWDGSIRYGAAVSHRFIGPVSLGGFIFQDRRFGILVGIEL